MGLPRLDSWWIFSKENHCRRIDVSLITTGDMAAASCREPLKKWTGLIFIHIHGWMAMLPYLYETLLLKIDFGTESLVLLFTVNRLRYFGSSRPVKWAKTGIPVCDYSWLKTPDYESIIKLKISAFRFIVYCRGSLSQFNKIYRVFRGKPFLPFVLVLLRKHTVVLQ
jgi:hypothetical protein